MKNIYFITGSQYLYGEETLRNVDIDSQRIVNYISEQLSNTINILWQSTVKSSEEVLAVFQQASIDPDCVGVITWMHTFSPAKMWIKGLQVLNKPLLHLHTQVIEKIPYDTIDMNYMNLNQSAHGDREYAFILKRMNIIHQTIVGYYQHEEVIQEIKRFAEVANAIDYSYHLKVAMFGSNMREVAVTDGDRVESQIKYGWEVNYYGIGDLVNIINQVTESEIEQQYKLYQKSYIMQTNQIEAVKEQAKYEIALSKFIKQNKIHAFCDTFEDLHGLNQLPGLAVQDLMNQGVGFAPEGDYKTAALSAILMKMAEKRKGATGFIEDYTYDLTLHEEMELGSHMLEVSPQFAAMQPKIEVHPLEIGNKQAPARLIFDGIIGSGIQLCMVDMGTHFTMIVTEIELVKPKNTPQLPVAKVMWKVKPDFKTGVKSWLENGGSHHSVISTALTIQDIQLFAKLTDTKLVII